VIRRAILVLGLAAMVTAGGPAVAQLKRGPYLQLGTPTSMVLRWRTGTATDSRVRYGPAPDALGQVKDDATSTKEHEVHLTGLTPDTLYYYSVGSTAQALAGPDAGHFFHTAPPSGTRRAYRIWVLGDAGKNNSGQQDVRDAYTAFNAGGTTDLWLMLGDNAYNSGTDSEYQKAVFDMYPTYLAQSVVWPTLGNHDAIGASSSTLSGPYYDSFTLPRQGEAGGVASGTEAYYSFDFGNIHFVCLNSWDVNRTPSGPMLTWLEQDLMANTQDWTVAFWHSPPYSKGSHDSDSEDDLIDMRENALPILESLGIDLVLCGHSHSYERSMLLDGHYGSSNTLIGAMKVDDGDGRIGSDGAYAKPSAGPAPHEGAAYVVAGSSGTSEGGDLDHPAMVVALDELGSVVLDVNGDQLDAKFINDSGTVRDYFTILKNTGDTVPNPPPASVTGLLRSDKK
jgi:acid phosphatase type 7